LRTNLTMPLQSDAFTSGENLATPEPRHL